MRAEKASARYQIAAQKERFRKEFPELAKGLDERMGEGEEDEGVLPDVKGDSCGYCGIGEGELGVSGGKLRFCLGCTGVRYCSLECQRGAWKAHKSLCVGATSPGTA